jgi:hypothetical protein
MNTLSETQIDITHPILTIVVLLLEGESNMLFAKDYPSKYEDAFWDRKTATCATLVRQLNCIYFELYGSQKY